MGDFLKDSVTNDLMIVNGKFLIGDTTDTDIKRLLICSPGQNHRALFSGIGIYNYINTSVPYSVNLNITELLRKNNIYKNVVVDSTQQDTININIL